MDGAILLVGEASEPFRKSREGFLDYLDRHGLDWRLITVSRSEWDALVRARHFDDLGVRVLVGFLGASEPALAWAASQGIPCAVVTTSGRAPALALAHATVDDAAVARVAARHLRDQGIRHAASIDRFSEQPLVRRRHEAFVAACLEEGLSCAVADRRPVTREAFDRERWYRESEAGLAAWLAGLPRPTGLFLHQDEAARWCLRLCQRHGLKVPDDVAIVGVDDQEEICGPAGLSSVIVPWRWLGQALARDLHRVLASPGYRAVAERGRTPSAGELSRLAAPPSTCAPRAVHRRRSTEVGSLPGDQLVSRALRWLRRRGGAPPRIGDLAARLAVSPQHLGARFRTAFGYGPKEFAQRQRIERAKELLLTDPRSITAIATALGFKSYPQFSAAFTRRTGSTPRVFRAGTAPGGPAGTRSS